MYKSTVFALFLPLFVLAQNTNSLKITGLYQKKNGNGSMMLKTDGTFTLTEFAGCDGTLESKGNWKVNKDTLVLYDIESRFMDDPFKKTGPNTYKLFIKKGILTAFSIVENKIIYNDTEIYKRKK